MSKKVIFIVEDDPDICELIQTVLDQGGYRTKVFLDSKNVGKDALKVRTDLIIMDLWMPGADGASLTKILKSKEKTKNIPIVLVSAKNSLEKISKQVRADGFLSKPFDIKDLIGVVKKFI